MDSDHIPISLLIDDSAPVNIMHWIHPEFPHERFVPNQFLSQFADLCDEYGARGKFTVLPMPAGLGRIDQSLATVSASHLKKFLAIVKDRLVGSFDITPELLTHSVAFNSETGNCRHVYEDEWVRTAGQQELTDYLCVALQILKNVGLPATGVTSPWATGLTNESVYQAAIAAAQLKVNRRRTSWYFLHTRDGPYAEPAVVWCDGKTGGALITIPATTDDTLWPTIYARSKAARKRAIADAADRLISNDGRSGQICQTVSAGHPVSILTHWQSLFSEGSATGLSALEVVFKRLKATFGSRLGWEKCSETAAIYVKNLR